MLISLARSVYPTDYRLTLSAAALYTDAVPHFQTHTSPLAARIHSLSEAILLPVRWNLQLLARLIQPLPGQDGDLLLWGMAVRISCIALWLLTLPFVLPALAVGFPLRLLEHPYRPAASYIDNSLYNPFARRAEELVLTRERPLTVCSHNLGLVTSSMSTVGDLRPPTERAREIVRSITEDPAQPDVYVMQEAFHGDALQILCDGLREPYPYILHSVAPCISGFNSGVLIASKYPLREAHFRRFGFMRGPERLSPRGIMRVRFHSARGPLLLYSVHMQALIGEERSRSRINQLGELVRFLQEERAQEPNALQLVVGDFNTAVQTVWGEDNTGQAEAAVQADLHARFSDLFLEDHSPQGERTHGAPIYLPCDNARMQVHLEEPRATWYRGPFAAPGLLLSAQIFWERWMHGRPIPERPLLEPSGWGTPAWRERQTADTARFDYVLVPRAEPRIRGLVEIRRVVVPPGAQSAPSDHLPVQARIWV